MITCTDEEQVFDLIEKNNRNLSVLILLEKTIKIFFKKIKYPFSKNN